MASKLTQPYNVPNFCFVVVNQVTLREDGRPLKRPYFPDVDDKNYDAESVLIQSDVDYPGTARDFGWAGEDHDLSGAYEFLSDNVGKIVR